jgi:hypothetical protein
LSPRAAANVPPARITWHRFARFAPREALQRVHNRILRKFFLRCEVGGAGVIARAKISSEISLLRRVFSPWRKL